MKIRSLSAYTPRIFRARPGDLDGEKLDAMLMIAVVRVDYPYLWTVVISGLLVNCSVLMTLDVIDTRTVSPITLVLGLALLSLLSLAHPEDYGGSPSSAAGEADRREIRTPVVDGLAVRVGPGREFATATAIWQVNRGEKLRVVDDTLGWIRFHVKYFDPDWSGWVRKEYTTVWETFREIQRIDRVRAGQNTSPRAAN